MNQFNELSLSPRLHANLAAFGFKNPTPVQAQAIPPALEGHDVVATAQTGTGKTIAFVLPLLQSLITAPPEKGVAAVILSPTRELALQIHETFVKLAAGTGIRSATVVGGMNEQRQLRDIRAGAQVLIATPGRLCDFLERRLVRLSAVRLLVLDEGDRMLDMGFLPAIQAILAPIPVSRQTLFYSATLEGSVAKLIETYLRNPVRIAVGSTSRPAEHVDLHVYEIDQHRKLSLLQFLLNQESGSFLIFARTKHGVERLAKQLSHSGFKAAQIHGDRTQSQRNQALHAFQRGESRILVATDVASRGIHVDSIAHVVNYDLPQIPEDFIHRVGRTGRAGSRGTASTFGTPAERGGIRSIERHLGMRLTRREVSSELTVIEPIVPARETAYRGPSAHAARPAFRSFNASRRRTRVR